MVGRSWAGLGLGLGLAFAAAGPVLAAEAEAPKTLVVTELEARGVPAELARATSEALLTALKARPGFRIIGHGEIRTILEHEGQRSLLSCTDDACLVELGRALRGDRLLIGSLGQVGQVYLLNAQLLDVGQAVVVGRASETALKPDELLGAAERVAAALLEAGPQPAAADDFALKPGAEPVKLAALDLASAGTEPQVAANLTQVVVHELKQHPGLSVIAKDEIQSLLLYEQDKMLLGCDDASCLAEIGGALGVEYLVSGSVGKVGDTYLLHLKLIHIREARIANRVAEAFQGQESQLIAAARYATRRLIGRRDAAPGKLSVVVNPERAELFLDGRLLESPAAVSLGAGKYNLRLAADGFEPWIGDVYVDPGGLTRLQVALVEIPVSWYDRWWLWTSVAAVVVGAGLGVGLTLDARGTTGAAPDQPIDPGQRYPFDFSVGLPQVR